jgi:3-keto-disaccharide hydrolase
MHTRPWILLCFSACFACAAAGHAWGVEPITPTKTTQLFNGKGLTGLYTWLQATGRDDPQHVFTVEDGVIHMKGGEHRGYVATQHAYRDYHVSVEYKWGDQTDGGKAVRNSGLLVHATGADGGAGKNAWMPCVEIQLAQGCEGDLIVIRGKDEKGEPVNVDLASHVRIAADKKTRWDPAGQKVKYSGRQFWWNNHMPFFKEDLDARGDKDVASPKGQWTKIEAFARGSTLTVKINGVTVNEAVDVSPAYGKILLQDEGHEVYFRNFVIMPLPPADVQKK